MMPQVPGVVGPKGNLFVSNFSGLLASRVYQGVSACIGGSSYIWMMMLCFQSNSKAYLT